jgi:asparagine synthase (glutamine-hydrolysing)
MIRQLGHRGPDDRGMYLDGEAGFGHTRLSIIDLAGGRQPMRSPCGRFCVTFNGEIFNYLELREDLVRRGHRFATQSDTEVLLHLYEEKGPACVQELNGQWAFAVWDERDRALFLSRDRPGILPLYYAIRRDTLAFASEIKALFALPFVERRLDLRGLDQVFTFWHPIGGRTLFEGVSELPPGHSLRFLGGRADLRPYWRPRPGDPAEAACGRDEAYAERLRDLLEDATRLRLRADVPIGAYLSGGLDSSVITGMIKRHADTPLRTFSVTFEDAEFDESAFQAEVVRHLRTEHSGMPCRRRDIGATFPDVLWHAEKPVLRTAPAPLFHLSRWVRRSGYKVVLTGEGSDEMLGGYDIFKEAKMRRFWGRQPDSRWRPLLLKRLYPYMPSIQTQPPAYLRAFFHVRPEDLDSPFFSHLPRWALTAWIKRLYSAGVRSELADYDAREDLRARLPEDFRSWPPFFQAQYLEMTGLMPGYILSSQGDRMLMSHSVEGRFPFLDHRVMEFAATIPPRLKMRGLDEKYVLKQAAGDLVPPAVKARPKQPYRAPDAASFVDPSGGTPEPEYVRERLDPRAVALSGIFDPAGVDALVRKARAGALTAVRDNMAFVGVLSTLLIEDQFIRHFREDRAHADR